MFYKGLVGFVISSSSRRSKQTYNWPLVYYGGAIRGGRKQKSIFLVDLVLLQALQIWQI